METNCCSLFYTSLGAPPLQKIIVFDLDGVIIDSRLCNYRAFAAGVEAAGLATPEEATVVALIGLPAKSMLEKLGCPAHHSESVYEEVVKPFYLDNLGKLAQAVVGAEQTLQELRQRGYRIGACTSGHRALQEQALGSLGLMSFFEVMQTPDDSAHRKPDTAYLREVVEQLGGCNASSIWHVEDSEIGLKMGLDFGATTVFADYGFGAPGAYRPHHRIASLENLLALV